MSGVVIAVRDQHGVLIDAMSFPDVTLSEPVTLNVPMGRHGGWSIDVAEVTDQAVAQIAIWRLPLRPGDVGG